MQPLEIYQIFLKEYGPQGWWPSKTPDKQWEMCIGAILTQNTSWKNVDKALDNLIRSNYIGFDRILGIDKNRLAELIRPSGFYRQKSERLKSFAEFVGNFGSVESFCKRVSRNDLLGLSGIGPETADSILLYACQKKEFVVDAYTKRVFSRVGLIKADNYEEVKRFLEKSLPEDVKLYQEFHALIVEHAKRHCRKVPDCAACFLKKGCKYYKSAEQ